MKFERNSNADTDFGDVVEERVNRDICEYNIELLRLCLEYRCAFVDDEEDCKEVFPNDDGDIYHIESMNPDAGRFNKNLTEEDYNNNSNLILLCPKHRRLVDFDLEYSVDDLHKMKTKRENQTLSRLQSDEGKEFIGTLKEIFKKYDFDQLLWRQDYNYYIPSNVNERMSAGSHDLLILCEKGHKWDIPDGIISQLSSFANDLENLRKHLTSYGESRENGSYIAFVRDCDSEEAEITRQKLEKLGKVYDMLRLI